MRATTAIALLGLASTQLVEGFYLPGVAPTSYKKEQRVPINVNALTPTISRSDRQLHAVVSYDYYHPSFHFCQPKGGPEWVRESLGSIIFGDRIRTSPFEVLMNKNETCKAICDKQIFDERSAQFVNQRIQEEYTVNVLVDGLPGSEMVEDQITHETFPTPGFRLGEVRDGQKHLFNHWDILIEYHVAEGDKLRVVGAFVSPKSQKDNKLVNGKAECTENAAPLILDEKGGTEVTYTYSVYWRPSDTAWATRWDSLLRVTDPSIHWFSLVNSTVFVLLLIAMVSAILTRALRRDIARYNRLDNINLDNLNNDGPDDDLQEDSGWKLVHGDVFRAPKHTLLLSILLGSGAQLFVMTGFTVVFALLGFLSPSNRGFLATVSLLLYTLLGCVGGYVSARCYKTYGGENWKMNIALTPLVVPGAVFGVFFLLNLFVWLKGASGAVPFTTFLAIIGIWFFTSVPSSVAGSWFGFKQPVPDVPTRVNQIPRQVPPVHGWSLRPWPSMAITGILPFCAIFVELYPILTSIWTSRFYYMFGFLFVCYGIMVLTAACTTILLVYFLLCAEDYRWQWRAFLGAGMTGAYVFLIGLWFWITRIRFGGLTGAILYLCYSALIGSLVFLLCGSIGSISSYWFIYRIYGSIKVD